MQQNSISNPFGYKKSLPNDLGVLILGIFSVVLIFCCGFLGIVLAVIAIVLGNQSKKIYQQNPHEYDIESLSKVNIGIVMSWVAIVLNILSFTFTGIILLIASRN